MTIKMRLDTDSLRALIKDNPELHLEIEKKVIDNIQRDSIQAKVGAQVDLCVNSLIRNEGSSWKPRYVPNGENMRNVVRTVISEIVTEEAQSIINAAVLDAVYSAVESEKNKFKLELKKSVSDLITPEMAKEILMEKLLK